jgi:hypothetical protein
LLKRLGDRLAGLKLEVSRAGGTGERRAAIDVQRPDFDHVAGAEERTNGS